MPPVATLSGDYIYVTNVAEPTNIDSVTVEYYLTGSQSVTISGAGTQSAPNYTTLLNLTDGRFTFNDPPGYMYSFSIADIAAVDIMDTDGNTYPNVFVLGRPVATVPCFLAGAPVLTPAGYKPIETLTEGDLVITGDGRQVAIQRIKRTLVTAGAAVDPYVIPKGRFGATRRLLISPNHRVQTGEGMQEARRLGLRQEEQSGTYVYYNLELPEWGRDTLVVAGVICESLAPVRRITVPAAVFNALVAKKYGAMTPAVAAKIQRTCRFLANGDVECPVMRNHKA